jgi:S1-C subfamily serine protease
MKRLIAAIVLTTTLASNASGADRLIFAESGWTVLEHSNRGVSFECSIGSSFSDGQSFQLILGASETWTLVLRKPGGYAPRISYNLTVAIDDDVVAQPTIVVSGSGDANIPLPASERILTAVGRGEALSVSSSKGTVRFSLRSGALAFSKVQSCLATVPGGQKFVAGRSPQVAGWDSVAELQYALIWAGYYTGLADGEARAGTQKAIADFQRSQGASTPSGSLAEAELQKLAQLAQSEMRRVGFRIINDERADLPIGIPTSLLKAPTPTKRGSYYVSPEGDLEIDTLAFAPGQENLADLAKRLDRSSAFKNVGYRVLRADRFVIAGDDGEKRHYTIVVATSKGLRGFSISVNMQSPFDQDGTYGKLIVAMASNLVHPRPSMMPPQVAVSAAPAAPPAQSSSAVPAAPVAPPNARAKPGTEASGLSVSSGTGIIVSKSGHILTNSHVVEDCSVLVVKGLGEGTVVRRDVLNDLAIMRVKADADLRPARFASADPSLGERILAFGYPLAGTLSTSVKVTDGIISSMFGVADDSRYMQVSAPIQPGNSGGPLVDQSGLVTGIVTYKLNQMTMLKNQGSLPENVAFALRASLAVSLLRSAGVDVAVEPQGTPRSSAEVSKDADRFTVQIICATTGKNQ